MKVDLNIETIGDKKLTRLSNKIEKLREEYYDDIMQVKYQCIIYLVNIASREYGYCSSVIRNYTKYMLEMGKNGILDLMDEFGKPINSSESILVNLMDYKKYTRFQKVARVYALKFFYKVLSLETKGRIKRIKTKVIIPND